MANTQNTPTSSTTAPSRTPGLDPHGFVDLRENTRIPILQNLTHTLFDETRDHVIIEEFTATMREAFAKRCVVMVATRHLAPGEFRILRWLTPDGQEMLPHIRTHQEMASVPIRRGGIIARACAGDDPKLALGFSVPDDPAIGDLAAPYRALAAVPLAEKSQPSDWLLILDYTPAAIVERDLEDLILRSNLVGLVIRNLNIAARLKEATAYIQSEIDQIAEIQRSLLPQELPAIPGLELAARYGTFDRAGGDYYDVFPDPAGFGRWGIIVADASGHGPSAAVVTAMLHSIVRNLDSLPAPELLLEEINRRLFARRIGNSFVTALAAVYDPKESRLEFAGAGHPPPILRPGATPADPRETDLDGGPPLGILDTVGSQRTTITLAPGDTILFYTDGISEAMSPQHKLFGTDRILDAVRAGPPTPQGILDAIDAALKAHIAGERPSDDQTILVLRRS